MTTESQLRDAVDALLADLIAHKIVVGERALKERDAALQFRRDFFAKMGMKDWLE